MEVYHFIHLLAILKAWSTLAQQHCESKRYAAETYTDLLNSDLEWILSSHSVCLTLCTSNRSCAAVSYDRTTSTCAMSGEPSVVNYPEDVGEQLTLVKESHYADLKVYEFSPLLAQGALMSLSSNYSPSTFADRAVDGIYVEIDSLSGATSMTHTKHELSPWIQADLKTPHFIWGVKIWNRSWHRDPSLTSVVIQRLANVRVTVGESDANFDDPPEDEICNYLPGKPDPADIISLPCSRRMYGRYVRVTAVNVTDFLNIYEMEVHGISLME